MVIFRPLVRWLLWSRRRFLLVVAATVLSGVAVSRGPALITFGGSSEPGPTALAAAPAPEASVSAPPPAESAPTSSPPVEAPPTSSSSSPTTSRSTPAREAIDDDPQEVALRFARAWASPQTAPREWRQRLAPLSTPEYAATVLTQVDPANVPASEVAAPPRRVRSGDGTAVYVVRFDTLEAEIELVELSQDRASESGGGSSDDAEGTTWRVAGMRPLRAT